MKNILLAFLVGLSLAATLATAAPGDSPPTIRSSTHAEGVPANASIAQFAWDPVAGSQYLHMLSRNATAEPQPKDNVTDEPSAQVLLPPLGQWYFHVVAVSGVDRSPTGHYGPVSRNLTVEQRCAAAFSSSDSDAASANEGALEECILATQNKFAPQAVLTLFIAFLAKFGSAALKRG